MLETVVLQLLKLFLAASLGVGLAMPAVAANSRGTCEWRSPAHDSYMGDVPSAVDSYTDIPKATRERLKTRMQRLDYDDIVGIRRDSIEGNFRYEPALRGMHFGKEGMCGEVTRKSWQPAHEERALAYCEDGQCIVVPMVCRNVSRVVRRPAVTGGGSPGGGAGAPGEPLLFDPPAAGLPAPQAAPDDPTAHPLAVVPPTAGLPVPGSDTPSPSVPLQPLPPANPTTPAGPGLGPIVTPPGLPPLPPAAPPVPEPATVLLWAAGLAAGAWCQRRRRAAASSDRA